MIDRDWLELTTDLLINYLNLDISWGHCKEVSNKLKDVFKQVADCRVVDPCDIVYLQPESCEVWGAGHRVLLIDDSLIIDPVARDSIYYYEFPNNVYYIEEYKRILAKIVKEHNLR